MAGEISRYYRDEAGRFVGVMADPVPARRAADHTRQIVVRRTRSGLDRHGVPFADYKPSTRRRKRSGLVNLTDTRLMLDRLTVRDATKGGSDGKGHSAELAFGTRRDERIARRHLGGTKRMAQRDFWGVTERGAQIILNDYGQDVRRRVLKDRRRRTLLLIGSL